MSETFGIAWPTMDQVMGFLSSPGLWVGYGVLALLYVPFHYRRRKKEWKEAVEMHKQNARYILESSGKAADEAARAEESRWLSSLTMPERLLATRLLVARIDELEKSDRPFLEQCRRIGTGPYPLHVSKRIKACNLMEIYFDQERESRSEILFWLEAVVVSVFMPAFYVWVLAMIVVCVCLVFITIISVLVVFDLFTFGSQ